MFASEFPSLRFCVYVFASAPLCFCICVSVSAYIRLHLCVRVCVNASLSLRPCVCCLVSVSLCLYICLFVCVDQFEINILTIFTCNFGLSVIYLVGIGEILFLHIYSQSETFPVKNLMIFSRNLHNLYSPMLFLIQIDFKSVRVATTNDFVRFFLL